MIYLCRSFTHLQRIQKFSITYFLFSKCYCLLSFSTQECSLNLGQIWASCQVFLIYLHTLFPEVNHCLCVVCLLNFMQSCCLLLTDFEITWCFFIESLLIMKQQSSQRGRSHLKESPKIPQLFSAFFLALMRQCVWL